MRLRMPLAVERLHTDVDVPGKFPRHLLPTNHATDNYSSWARSLSTFGAYDVGLSMTDDMVANDKERKLFVKLVWDPQGFFHRASKAKWIMQHLDEDERARVRDLSHQF
eukprot:368956-Pyramimonas_sp.AAC.1